MGALIGLLVAKGLSERAARFVAYAGLVLLIVAMLGTAKCAYDRKVVADYKAEQEAKAATAREKAADRRAEDAIKNAKSEEGLHNAIQSAPKGGTVSPAAHALACERLRRVGRIPASCRPGSGDGSQAGSH